MDILLQPHHEATRQRVGAEKLVVAVQDTTSLNYSAPPATENLGPIGSKKEGLIGLLLHSTMAFNAEGTPLGLLQAQHWVRDRGAFGQRHQRKQRPIEEKESAKWLESFRCVTEVQRRSPGTRLVSVGDREADVYELFQEALADPKGPWLLIRPEQDRLRGEGQGHLCSWVGEQPRAGHPGHPGSPAGRSAGTGGALGGAFCAGHLATAGGEKVARTTDAVGRADPGNGSALGDRTAALDAADHLRGGELRGGLRKAALVHPAVGN